MLKHIAAIIAVSAILVGCEKPAESTAFRGAGFKVETLFTHEGCTVYRFADVGNFRYYTNCKSGHHNTTVWNESCGNGCSRGVEITTVGE